MNRFRKSVIYFIGLLLAVICVITFQKNLHKDNKVVLAKGVLEITLNAPDTRIAGIYESMFSQMQNSNPSGSGIQSISEEEPKSKLTQYLGSAVNDHFIDSCLANNDPMGLQYYCILNQITSQADSIEVVKTKEKNQYSYDAVLRITDNATETMVHVNGMVLFDDEGKIDQITLQGRELEMLYQSSGS